MLIRRMWLLLLLLFIVSGFLLAPVYSRDDQGGIIDDPEPIILEECGTIVDPVEYQNEIDLMMSGWNYPDAFQKSTPYFVPLTLHVVRRSDQTGGITPANLATSVNQLIDQYLQVGVSFYMQGAVDYIDDDYYYNADAWSSGISSENFVPNTLNIYYVPTMPSYCGYASFSSTYTVINNYCATNGSSVAHEVGHIFKLYHTHQCCNECPDGSNCTTNGDLICDTPADPGLSGRVAADCSYTGTVTPPAECGSTPYNPDTSNLMSYSLKSCRDYFSSMQINKMVYVLEVEKPGLIGTPPPRMTYYVEKWGNDANDGSAITPFRTIGRGISQAALADTVLVGPGDYNEALVIDKIIVVKSTDGPKATTISHDQSANLVEFVNVASDDARLEGFKLEGGWIGVRCTNSGPTIIRNILTEQNVTDWAAVVLAGSGYGNTGDSPAVLINNTIVSSANGGVSNFSTSPPIIMNNIIAYNTYGIHQEESAAAPENSYNDVWGNVNGDNYLGNIGPGTGSISTNPHLNDFNLEFGSPCIDAGHPDEIYFDPDGTRNDMGALYGGVEPAPIIVRPGESIQDAIDSAISGSTIHVRAGTYDESLNFHGKSLKVIGIAGPDSTFLTPGNFYPFTLQMDPGSGEGNEFSGFTISNQWCVNSIQVQGSILIQNCVFHDIASGGCSYNWDVIRVSGQGSNHAVITRNVFVNCNLNGCVGVWAGNSAEVINNTFYGNRGGVRSASDNVVVKNNIIVNSTTFGVSGTFSELDYNDVWNNGSDYADGASAGAGSISGDPLFVDEDARNFIISALSPCKNAGDPDPIYNDPDGSRNDIGAYQAEEGRILPPLHLTTGERETGVPSAPHLLQNYPNPFRLNTEIGFELSNASNVVLDVYNVKGERVARLLDRHVGAGRHSIVWDGTTRSGKSVASGIYWYRITASDYSETKKMILLR